MAASPRSVRDIADDYVERYALLDPTGASRSMGVARDATTVTDLSPQGHEARAELYRSVLGELRVATPADEVERIGAAFLADQCSAQLALVESGERQRMVSHLAGAPAQVRMSFDVMGHDDDDGWERVASRLEDVPGAMAGYRESLEWAVERGPGAAPRLVAAVAEQCEGWTGWFSGFVAPYGDGPLRSRLDAAAASAGAAYGELARWLRSDYGPRAAAPDGVGPDRYRLWGAATLGADLDLDEAYAWAGDELQRLDREKAEECAAILPGEPLAAVVAHIEADPAGSVTGVDAYRDALQSLLDEATAALTGSEFDIPPELSRCVVGIPPEGTAAAPYYSPPSEDLVQPATTWFPTLGDDRFPMWDKHTTVYHEAVPGHHLQIGLLRVLPLVRAQRLGIVSAHAEGWALYAERLMDELGWFRTPATRLGFLCMQAFRAARVVVDIGLHTGRDGWTYERAVDAMAAAGGKSRAFAESEVLRYLSWPTQATTYKLGERAWLAGRSAAVRAAAAQGLPFDRPGWHQRALALGPLGLDRLEIELAAL